MKTLSLLLITAASLAGTIGAEGAEKQNGKQISITGAEPDLQTGIMLISGKNFADPKAKEAMNASITMFTPEIGEVALQGLAFDAAQQVFAVQLPAEILNQPGTYRITVRTGSSASQYAESLVAIVGTGFNGVFTGNGAGLVGLQANAVTTGILNDARLSSNIARLNSSPIFTGSVTATQFNGNGTGLTAIPAASLTGVISDNRLSANVSRLDADQINTGAKQFINPANVFVGEFHGNGAGITNVNVATLMGVLEDSQLTQNIARQNTAPSFAGAVTAPSFAGSGANLSDLDASKVTAGSLADARLSGNVALQSSAPSFAGPVTAPAFAGNGANISGLDASELALGTVPDPRLASNIARLNSSPTFDGQVTAPQFNGSGAGLIDIQAAALTGVIDDNRLSSNVSLLDADQVLSGAKQLTNDANLFVGKFIGDGAELINVGVANLSGVLADNQLPANVARLNGSAAFAGNVSAPAFVGSGAGLANLDASKITAGQLADGRLSGNVALTTGSPTFAGPVTAPGFAGNGANLTGLNASTVASGTLHDGRLSQNVALLSGSPAFAGDITAPNFIGSGAKLTAIRSASLIGEIADARLSKNVSLLDENEVIAGAKQLTNEANLFIGTFAGDGANITNLPAPILPDNIVTRSKIAAGSVGSSELIEGSVTSAKLADGSIISVKIAAGAVGQAHIDANAVTTSKIASGAVTTSKIATGAVESEQLAANAVTTGKISGGAVTSAKIATGGVENANLANSSVTSDKIKTGAVGNSQLADDSVGESKIKNGAVGNAQLAADSVTGGKIAADAVGNSELADDSVSGGKIRDGAVGSSELDEDSVGEINIKAGAVGNAQLAADSVTGGKIAAAAVGNSELADDSISASKIKDGAVGNAQLANGSITTAKIASGGVGSSEIADDSISEAKIKSGAVGNAQLAADSISGSKIQAGAVGNSDLADDSVSESKIRSGAVGNSQLAADSVTSGKIDGGAVGTSELADKSVTNAKIADDAVTGSKLANDISITTSLTVGTTATGEAPLHIKRSVAPGAGTAIRFPEPKHHVAIIENTYEDDGANGLAIKLSNTEPRVSQNFRGVNNLNNYVTFYRSPFPSIFGTGNSPIAGRIEGVSNEDYEILANELAQFGDSFFQFLAFSWPTKSVSFGALGSVSYPDPSVGPTFGFDADAYNEGMEGASTTELSLLIRSIKMLSNPTQKALIQSYMALNGSGVTYESGSGDYAEWLQRSDENEKMKFGDIVGLFSGKISKNTAGADQIMVISRKPIVLGNMPEEGKEELSEKVAFMGQVPVKIVGTIQKGDYVLPSGRGDGTGRAVSKNQITVEQLSQVLGISWGESDLEQLKYIRVAVGLRPQEFARIAEKQAEAQRALSSANAQLNAEIVALKTQLALVASEASETESRFAAIEKALALLAKAQSNESDSPVKVNARPSKSPARTSALKVSFPK